MLSLLTVLLLSPGFPFLCDANYFTQTSPSATASQLCADNLLKLGYRTVNEESLSFDPKVKVKPSLALWKSKKVEALLDAAAQKGQIPEWKAMRLPEILADLTVPETAQDANLKTLKPLLVEILAGRLITEVQLKAQPLSKGELRVLRNAAYARHGYRFKSADLTAVFYGERGAIPGLILPLPKGHTKAVKLSAIDGKNVRMIKALAKTL